MHVISVSGWETKVKVGKSLLKNLEEMRFLGVFLGWVCSGFFHLGIVSELKCLHFECLTVDIVWVLIMKRTQYIKKYLHSEAKVGGLTTT